MAIRPIVIYGQSDVLRAVCRPLDFLDEQDFIYQTARDLVDSLRHHQGTGLAAPQIGIPVRMIALTVSEFRTSRLMDEVLVNPEIIFNGGSFAENIEGCLSFPGLREAIPRFQHIKVAYWNVDGKKRMITPSIIDRGYLARCLRHEIDHLDGTLIIDYLSSVRQKVITKQMTRIGKNRCKKAA